MGSVAKGAIRKTRKRAGRSNIQADQEAFDEHIRQIGEIVYLWNRLHGELFMVFWGLTDRENHEFAHGIWHSVQSDSGQRQMVESAAKAKLGSRLAGHVLWICRGYERLARYRNAFAHVGFYYSWGDGFVPDDSHAKKTMRDLFESQPKIETFNLLRGDLIALVLYAEDVAFRIFYAATKPASPWLERPRLRLAPATPPTRSKARHLDTKAKRQPPP